MKAVAHEGTRGRQLYAGAVDLDNSGTFKAFNLTEIAGLGGEVAGPPKLRRRIDGLDGDSRDVPCGDDRSGHLRRRRDPPQHLRRSYHPAEVRRLALESAAPVEPTIYCLVYGTLNVGRQEVPRKVLDIARRTVDVLLDESTDGNLLRIYLQAPASDTHAAFPHDVHPLDHVQRRRTVGSEENQFDPQLMRCLYDEGRRFAKEDPEPWRTEPPLEVSKP